MDDEQLIHKLIDIFQYKDYYQSQSSNIQSQDMYVLEKIAAQNHVKIKDLAQKYGIPPSTLTGIIDRLESKKYIQRVRSNLDRRTIELVLTIKGKNIVAKHLREDKIFAQNLFNSLPENKKILFKELLTELLKKVKKEKLFLEKKQE